MFGKISLGVGIAFALALFALINQSSMLGMTCYHVGEFSMQSACIFPGVYRGAWILAIALIAFGAWRVFRSSNKVRAPQ